MDKSHTIQLLRFDDVNQTNLYDYGFCCLSRRKEFFLYVPDVQEKGNH